MSLRGGHYELVEEAEAEDESCCARIADFLLNQEISIRRILKNNLTSMNLTLHQQNMNLTLHSTPSLTEGVGAITEH